MSPPITHRGPDGGAVRALPRSVSAFEKPARESFAPVEAGSRLDMAAPENLPTAPRPSATRSAPADSTPLGREDIEQIIARTLRKPLNSDQTVAPGGFASRPEMVPSQSQPLERAPIPDALTKGQGELLMADLRRAGLGIGLGSFMVKHPEIVSIQVTGPVRQSPSGGQEFSGRVNFADRSSVGIDRLPLVERV